MDNNVEGGIHRPPRFCTLASAPAAAGVAAPAAVGVAPAACPAPAAEEHHPQQEGGDYYQDDHQKDAHQQIVKELLNPVQPVEPGVPLHRAGGHQIQGAVGLSLIHI